VDSEIATTLGELERKLVELERALSAIGEREQAASAWERPSGGRLVDEAVEAPPRGDGSATTMPRGPSAPPPSAPPPPAPSAGYGAEYRAAGGTGARREPAAEAPSAPGAGTAREPGGDRAPSAAELLRFRERLERTARELTQEYDALLGRLREPAAPAPAREPAGGTISFARGAPSLDIVDVDGLREAAARAFDSDPGGSTAYGTSIGYPRLRAWIADRHGVAPERVLVTNGSMQADAFLFEHLVRPGDDVVVERPTYDRTLLSLRQRGARLSAIDLLGDGIDTEALARLLGDGSGVRPRLAHIIPNFQNPAGHTLSMAKRRELLALASQYGFLVFEDDPYVALRFSGESLPTMLSMDPERVVYASSFSKTVCPGIRVGYLVGPPDIIDAIARLATNTYISPSMVSQAIVFEFCASGAIERSIETVRSALAQRAAALAGALRREMPEAQFLTPEGGYFMWVTLPAGTDVHRLQTLAADRGVAFVKGTDFMLDGGESSLRLAYAGVTPAQIEEGVARLAAAYRSL
jgi:2-aminoadipate transaminase